MDKIKEKSVSFSSSELTEVYQALFGRIKFFEDYFNTDDESFRLQYGAIYLSYLETKRAFEKVDSVYFG